MKLQIILLLSFLILIGLVSQESESGQPVLTENISIVKKELQRRKYYLTPKKYHFRLLNKQTVQFILVKQGRMFSTGIGVHASTCGDDCFRNSINGFFDVGDHSAQYASSIFSTFLVNAVWVAILL